MEMDPDVGRYLGGAPRSRAQAERMLQERTIVTVPDRLGVHATVLKPNRPYIGRCGLYPHFGTGDSVIDGEATLASYIARVYGTRFRLLTTERGVQRSSSLKKDHLCLRSPSIHADSCRCSRSNALPD